MKSGKSHFASMNPKVEQALVDQVAEFGLTSRIAWQKTSQLKDHPPREITQTLRELTKQGVLEAHPLHHGRFYFTFTRQAAAKHGRDNTHGGPYDEAEKLRAYTRLMLAPAICRAMCR